MIENITAAYAKLIININEAYHSILMLSLVMAASLCRTHTIPTGAVFVGFLRSNRVNSKHVCRRRFAPRPRRGIEGVLRIIIVKLDLEWKTGVKTGEKNKK